MALGTGSPAQQKTYVHPPLPPHPFHIHDFTCTHIVMQLLAKLVASFEATKSPSIFFSPNHFKFLSILDHFLLLVVFIIFCVSNSK